MKKFNKIKEDFICEKCQFKNIGDGFTNHCSNCFYSKHLDIFPGDRLEKCRGLMEPIEIKNGKKNQYIILHKCKNCQKISKDKFREKTDNFNNFLKLVESLNKKREI